MQWLFSYTELPSKPIVCSSQWIRLQFSFLFIFIPLTLSPHLMAFNAKYASIIPKFASLAKDLSPKLHVFISNCLFKSPFRSLKKSQIQCVAREFPVAPWKTSTWNFPSNAKFYQLLMQNLCCYIRFPLFHIPLLIWLKILCIPHTKPIWNAVLLTISLSSHLNHHHLCWLRTVGFYGYYNKWPQTW